MKLMSVVTTVAETADAEVLAEGAVGTRLAACVQIEAVRSVYRWQASVRQDAEWRLDFKTTSSRLEALVAWLRERHPYELPALHAIPIEHATADYAAWVAESVDATAADAGATTDLDRLAGAAG